MACPKCFRLMKLVFSPVKGYYWLCETCGYVKDRP